MKQQKTWADYLWIIELLYLTLGLFNILFAWLGLIFFITPLLISIFGGSKVYCNRFCGRGQLLGLLGHKLKLSRKATPPKFLHSRWFRYGFLTFFMIMFGLMLYSTYKVFSGAPLKPSHFCGRLNYHGNGQKSTWFHLGFPNLLLAFSVSCSPLQH